MDKDNALQGPYDIFVAEELAQILEIILNLPTRSGTVGDNYLPQTLKDRADQALARWRCSAGSTPAHSMAD